VGANSSRTDDERAAFEEWWKTTRLSERNQAWLGWLARSIIAGQQSAGAREAASQPAAVTGQEPVAWIYEFATAICEGRQYSGWEKRLTSYLPNVPEGSIRNIIKMVGYTAPQSAPEKQAARGLTDEQREDIARTIHRDCTLIPGATFHNAAKMAIESTLRAMLADNPVEKS
jgi:hypothetical protein